MAFKTVELTDEWKDPKGISATRKGWEAPLATAFAWWIISGSVIWVVEEYPKQTWANESPTRIMSVKDDDEHARADG